MDNNILMKFISFWAFMLGVAVFGKLMGFLEGAKQSILIFIGAAIIFVVWTVAREKGKRKREEREEAERRNSISRKGSGKKNRR